jgi:hypothetical protein
VLRRLIKVSAAVIGAGLAGDRVRPGRDGRGDRVQPAGHDRDPGHRGHQPRPGRQGLPGRRGADLTQMTQETLS